jgi:hypothetical protein
MLADMPFLGGSWNERIRLVRVQVWITMRAGPAAVVWVASLSVELGSTPSLTALMSCIDVDE